MSRAAYANLVTQITVDGISSLGTVPLPVALGHPQEKAVVRRPRATGRGPG
jgi:hypothetical protein